MSNFDIDIEIDKLIDKLGEQLKTRLKKLVVRSEKQVLRQYIASQKDTKTTFPSGRGRGTRNYGRGRGRITGLERNVTKKDSVRVAPKREKDYGSASESEYSDSE